MGKFVTRFMSNETGATAIEYGLLSAGIGIVILVGIGLVGNAVNANYSSIATAL